MRALSHTAHTWGMEALWNAHQQEILKPQKARLDCQAGGRPAHASRCFPVSRLASAASATDRRPCSLYTGRHVSKWVAGASVGCPAVPVRATALNPPCRTRWQRWHAY